MNGAAMKGVGDFELPEEVTTFPHFGTQVIHEGQVWEGMMGRPGCNVLSFCPECPDLAVVSQ